MAFFFQFPTRNRETEVGQSISVIILDDKDLIFFLGFQTSLSLFLPHPYPSSSSSLFLFLIMQHMVSQRSFFFFQKATGLSPSLPPSLSLISNSVTSPALLSFLT